MAEEQKKANTAKVSNTTEAKTEKSAKGKSRKVTAADSKTHSRSLESSSSRMPHGTHSNDGSKVDAGTSESLR